MSAYAVGYFPLTKFGPDIETYLNTIDETLKPFGGRFLVHGGESTLLEGSWSGDLVVIGFPDRDSALGWYRSDAYQAIIHLRTNNVEGDVIVIQGVPEGHRAKDILAGQKKFPPPLAGEKSPT